MVAIGICAAVERVRWAAWDETVTMAPRSYARAVQAAGALAFVLPPDPRVDETADDLLEHVDGLLLAGGSDIDPATYGAQPHPETKGAWPERDVFEVALTRRALALEMPVLGICRGLHLINVALGGTLVQHLPDVVGHGDHRHTPGRYGDHEVRLAPGSLAARVIGSERETVKSHHHQGVDRLGDGLVPTGWAVEDDLVEALELPAGAPFGLAVLWHPEEDEGSRVIGALVEAAQGVGAPA